MLEADIVIIGGGVAGAVMADALAGAGYSVLVLEAGRAVQRDAALEVWAAGAPKSATSPYRDHDNDTYASTESENAGFKSNYLRVSGGSTWHFQGSTPRLLPSDFEMRRRYGVGVDWPIDYATLEKFYVRAEEELGVSGDGEEWKNFYDAYRSKDFPMPPIWSSYSDREFTRRLGDFELDGKQVRVRRVPQARNSQPYQNRPPCAGNSSCIPLCPIGAKYDATVHLKRAREKGAKVVEQCVVSRLALSGTEVQHLELKHWGNGAVRDDTARSLRGIYVLAAHAIESARLLLLSGAAKDDSSHIGRNLMDHPAGQIVGLAPEPWYTFRGPPVTSGIDEWRDGRFRSSSAAWKISLGNDGHGRFRSPEDTVLKWLGENLIGVDLRKKVTADGSRLFRLSWGIEQLPVATNRVTRSDQVDALGLPKAKLTYGLDDYTRAAITEVRQKSRLLLERVGAKGIEIAADPFAFTGSGHIMGTCRMAADPADGVVDSNCRSFDYPDLFIVGSAVFPTVGTANPTLTVAALALRAADHIRASLGAP